MAVGGFAVEGSGEDFGGKITAVVVVTYIVAAYGGLIFGYDIRISGNDGREQKKDENAQSISEATLNKLVGTVEAQNLEEMQPPSTLTCDLRPYQKQALHWMTSLEYLKREFKNTSSLLAAYQVKDE